METITKSPKITDLSWGNVQVETGSRYKDVKLWPGGSRVWDWNETGTHHTPGVQPDDVKEIVDRGAGVVVLSSGMSKRLQVQQKTIDWLNERGIDYHVLQTEDAVKRYNNLADEEAVGALIHSTC